MIIILVGDMDLQPMSMSVNVGGHVYSQNTLFPPDCGVLVG